MAKKNKILIAPDSFKGSVSSPEAARAIERGLRRVRPDIEVAAIPMADGGEGTTQALLHSVGGELIPAAVTDPLGNPITAHWARLNTGVAVIEMAASSGLPLVLPDKRDPSVTTTYGTGELIRAALDAGCRRLLIGIGGSATNDGGAGMAQALGARLLDERGNELGFGGAELARLNKIDLSGLDSRLAECEISVASDVTNPLTGERGASRVYGPQKGASPDMVSALDAALVNYGEKLRECFGRDIASIPGAGAAGGLGAGLVAFCGATLQSGIGLVLELSGAREKISRCDLVITGEGRTDASSAMGKVPSGIGALAREFGVPVVCLTGSIGAGFEALYDMGVSAVIPIADGPITLEDSMRNAGALLEGAAERLMRLLSI
jgi:glycerate kinase